ncbi:hypothetical protein GLOIN_2v1765163 [Rhizophagus irregularis DAOM 181602=DAOM 197198]|nr:hypothetical protein GLOIN_2v1765163 [Rhizophagus irregularis DAOM 181602=DAOM 197198]
MFPLFLFTCTLILTILTILTTCLFFPFSLFLYSFVQLLCRYRNIYLLILIILILTHFFFTSLLLYVLCKITEYYESSNYGTLRIIEFRNILKSCEVLRSKITEYYESKNKNTEKDLASDNRNKTITNINKSSSNIQQAVEGTATPIHERAQTTNINKSSSNIQQAVEGTATPIHDHERAQSVKERYKNLRLPDSSNTQPPSAPSHERVQSVKERYKNLWLPVRYQTNEPTRDNDDASTGLIGGYLKKYPICVRSVYTRLREDNEFLAGVNAEFGSENDDLKEEVNELKTKLEQYQIRSSSESLDVIDVPKERLAKRFKSDRRREFVIL